MYKFYLMNGEVIGPNMTSVGILVDTGSDLCNINCYYLGSNCELVGADLYIRNDIDRRDLVGTEEETEDGMPFIEDLHKMNKDAYEEFLTHVPVHHLMVTKLS